MQLKCLYQTIESPKESYQKGTIVKINKENYIIVVDYFQRLIQVEFNQKKYLPFKSPDWLPITIFKITNSDIPKEEVVYESFRTTLDKNIKLRFKNDLVKAKKITCGFQKICENCLNCPRFLLFKIKIKKKKKYISDNFSLTYQDNKLSGIPYNIDGYNKYLEVNFIPIYLIKKVLQKENNFIISLPFDNSKRPIKIGKNKIDNGFIFNTSLKMNLPVDVNLLIEGEFDNEEIVSYSKDTNKLKYYQIDRINDTILVKDFIKDSLTLGFISYTNQLQTN